uniref:Transmembrane protein 223 n=1 Tax=Globisporangium ultimum (strain ATCC 200006 / CBS 805.95 / DAOM BR144) TaxID=431595 RepID=K3W7N6_GLOUD
MVMLVRSGVQLLTLQRMAGASVRAPTLGGSCSVRFAAAELQTPLWRSFSSKAPDAKGAADAMSDSKKEDDAPLTNEKLWDSVLKNQPEQGDKKNGDLLYEYPRKSYFGILSAGSLAHIAFWSWLKGYEESLAEMLPLSVGEPTPLSWLTNDFGSTLGFGSSILLAFLIGFHARRAVARISVVSGGDKLRITTHKFFGDFGKPFDVPAAYVSANPNMTNNIIMKVANHRAFYLVDVKGTFYNRKKLESMITFRTDFSAHKSMIPDEEKMIEVRTDLPRTEWKQQAQASTAALPKKRSAFQGKGQHNLLGRKPAGVRKSKGGKKK